MGAVSSVFVRFVGPDDLDLGYHWTFGSIPTVGSKVILVGKEYAVVKHTWTEPTKFLSQWQITITLENE